MDTLKKLPDLKLPRLPELPPITEPNKKAVTLYLQASNYDKFKEIVGKQRQNISAVIDYWIDLFIKQKEEDHNQDNK